MKNSCIHRFTMFLLICLLFTCTVAGAADAVNNPKACKLCGMDLEAAARSRMLIVFSDETTVEVCSLHCAVEEMKQNKDKQVKSIMVADYSTGKMIDAGTATWTVGGEKMGVMTSVAKWAFAGAEDAQKFVKETGGELTSFDQVMKAAADEVDKETGHHAHHHEHMGPGAQMLYNPAFGDDIYHTHPAGMWMVNYKYMYENMGGLRAGGTNVDTHSVGHMDSSKSYNYMMIPTYMDMHMHMFMAMYGVTDSLTLMGMANYVANDMDMLMNMGKGKPYMAQATMRTAGFSDTELRGLYKINKYLVGSLGVSIPTGDINQTDVMMGKVERAPYDMQLGSGTWDLKPALTYNDLSDDSKWKDRKSVV
jgi:copper chaperone NosL